MKSHTRCEMNGRIAVITRGASRIGSAIAHTLAGTGALVGIADPDAEAAQALVKELCASGGRSFCFAIGIDAGKAAHRTKPSLTERRGNIDVLISHAGVEIVSPVKEFSLADWRKVLALQDAEGFLTKRIVLRHILDDVYSGALVIYSGAVHSQPMPSPADYLPVKHGLLGLVRGTDGGQAVRHHVVCPHFVRTPLLDCAMPLALEWPDLDERRQARRPVFAETDSGRFPTPEEVASTLLFIDAVPSATYRGQVPSVARNPRMS